MFTPAHPHRVAARALAHGAADLTAATATAAARAVTAAGRPLRARAAALPGEALGPLAVLAAVLALVGYLGVRAVTAYLASPHPIATAAAAVVLLVGVVVCASPGRHPRRAWRAT